MDDIGTAVVPDRSTILAVFDKAGRAPSVHNTQPWRWVFDGSRLHLYRDTTRRLTSADAQGRQLVISCGAMLDHVRTAFAAAGWHTDVTRFPDTAADHLATLDLRPWSDPPAAVAGRAAAMERRYTDRLPMLPPHDWDRVLEAAQEAARRHEISVQVLDESTRPRLAAASERAAALRRYDPQYQNELRWWAGHDSPADGVPVSALVSEAEMAQVGVGRAFPAGPPSRRRDDITDRSRLLVLGTETDSERDWLRTGEALSAILLECTVAGLATCSLTHITELPTSRRIVGGLLRRPALPQVLVRVGTTPSETDQSATPRRAVTDILELHRTV